MRQTPAPANGRDDRSFGQANAAPATRGTELELQILLCAARTDPQPAAWELLTELIDQQPDWRLVLASAERHRIVALLHHNLSRSGRVPGEVLLQLDLEARRIAERNRFLTAELIRLLGLLDAAGLRAVPFKGPTLAEAVYGGLEMRQYEDVDILVYRRDFPAARELLIAEGYKPVKEMPLRLPLIGTREASHGFEHSNGGAVDLQWGVTITRDFAFPVDDASFWNRLETVRLAGAPVRRIPAPDLLQILCLHGSRHQWHRVQWIADIAQLVAKYDDLPWATILASASELGNSRTLLLGLRLARDFLATALPPEVDGALAEDRMIAHLADAVGRRFRERQEGEMTGADYHIFNLRLKERSRDRVLYLARKAATLHRDDVGDVRLPAAASILYLPLRLLRLAAQYGRSPSGVRRIFAALFAMSSGRAAGSRPVAALVASRAARDRKASEHAPSKGAG